MIELTDYRGNKVLIHTKDIREVRGYFDQRYPSIQSVIILYDGKKIECSHPYDVVKNLTIQRVRHFQFLSSNSGNEIIEELDTDMHPPIKGQYVWLKTGVRFQVTAVHHDYNNRTLKIYCA